MIKICKTCKKESEVCFNELANLRCKFCNSPDCSFEQDAIIKCYYCKRVINVLEGRYVNVINTCYQSIGQVQRSLWTIIEVVQADNEKPILTQINECRVKLLKDEINIKPKKIARRRGRPKKSA